jgi:sugar/nucleoside kinase (ribokinase family)
MPGTVVGVGHATVDLLGVVPRYPARDSKVELLEYSKQGGGTIATAIAAAAALGAPARFVGKVGDDDFGRFILDGLREYGVDLSRVVVAPGGYSPLSFVVVDRETATRTIFYTRGDLAALAPEEVNPAVLDDAKVLLVDGMQPGAQIATAEAARERGVRVLLGAGSLHEGMGELMALADVVIASERFLSEIAPRGELEDSLVELLRMGPSSAIVTLGEAGSIGLEGRKLVRQPAFEVRAIDTTGAGDVYHGALACALSDAWPLERAMRFASTAAGMACRALGGRAAIPDRQEVVEACGW